MAPTSWLGQKAFGASSLKITVSSSGASTEVICLTCRSARAVGGRVEEAVEVRLHRGGVERRAVLELDVGADLDRPGHQVLAARPLGGERRDELGVGVVVDEVVVDGERGQDVRRLGQAAGRVEAGDVRLHAEHDLAADLRLALGLRLVEPAGRGVAVLPGCGGRPAALVVAPVVVAPARSGDQREDEEQSEQERRSGLRPAVQHGGIPPKVVCSERWSGGPGVTYAIAAAGNVGPWWHRVNNPPRARAEPAWIRR